MELIQQLTQGLNIKEEQAEGGAGLIFKMAQEKLGDGEFAQVANAIPGITSLIGAAPQGGAGVAGAIGGLAGAMGGGGQIANIAALAGGFSQLGLNPGMATKFIPIILSFVQSQGGDGVKNILANVLK
ncbi:conserved hypothetical protein [Hyella patelloides LEGE 07179]|uniref:DUF2780 domain-containing protein n=1 Tax=Hyella patelloides LEGE 07179 TaxID=945734 RepID=A0A563W2C1_9CYAN|nr:DUF2780 domain-containing protein [Hyella patelloides]VEP17849.1 conserved hypothetical protein [Hyella patelloides LEGE 07179]